MTRIRWVPIIGSLVLILCCTQREEREIARPRVISLVPSVTETIFALGGEDHLLAVTSYCNFPEEARSLPQVGDLTSPSYERIVELDPDIVYVMLPLQRKICEDLERLGISCIDISPESFDEIYLSIGEIAVHLGKWGAGDTLVYELRDALEEEITHRLDPPVSVYLEVSDRPLYTIGGRSFVNEILRAAGGLNVFQGVDQDYFVTSSEDVLERAPQVIVLLHEGEGVQERLSWSNIPAVKSGRIVDGLDLDLMSRPGPRFVEAVRTLREVLVEVRKKN
jgi:iron complex transport system substrate-binding protein